MPLPNFLCIGVPKAGTTTLYDILKQHPEIYLSETKEIHFFDKDERFNKGLNWYSNEFLENYNNEKVIGEITPGYLRHESAAKRIYDTLGKDMKFIVLLRNPVNRAFSAYWMKRRTGKEKTESFLKALEPRERYIRAGLYATNIKRFLQYYPKDKIHFVLFEDLTAKNNQKTIDGILNFLEVSQIHLKSNIHSHKGGVYRSKVLQKIQPLLWLDKIREKFPAFRHWIMQHPKIRDFFRSFFMKKGEELTAKDKQFVMEEYFIEEIKEMETIIGKDLSHWYKAPLIIS